MSHQTLVHSSQLHDRMPRPSSEIALDQLYPISDNTTKYTFNIPTKPVYTERRQNNNTPPPPLRPCMHRLTKIVMVMVQSERDIHVHLHNTFNVDNLHNLAPRNFINCAIIYELRKHLYKHKAHCAVCQL